MLAAVAHRGWLKLPGGRCYPPRIPSVQIPIEPTPTNLTASEAICARWTLSSTHPYSWILGPQLRSGRWRQNCTPAEWLAGELAAKSPCTLNCVELPSRLPCTCRELLQAQAVTIICSMQIRKRLNVFGGIPWEVFQDLCQSDRMAATLTAMEYLMWDDLVSGFTPEAVGSPGVGIYTASLLMITTPNWTSGEHCSLVVSSTAVM